MIRHMKKTDLDNCANILCEVYNNDTWQCRWSVNTAIAYLKDYFDSKKFVGFVLEKDKQLCGAMFCHEKIWWNNSELFIDEMFVKPELQKNGEGRGIERCCG
ncbi:MAG: hypothetical protein ACRDBO_02255 [Lachnospiraceae bacterium]